MLFTAELSAVLVEVYLPRLSLFSVSNGQNCLRQVAEDGPVENMTFVPDREHEDEKELDPEDPLAIPDTESGKTLDSDSASNKPDDGNSDDDCQILEPVAVTPLNYSYPPQTSTEGEAPPPRASKKAAVKRKVPSTGPARKKRKLAGSGTRPTSAG